MDLYEDLVILSKLSISFASSKCLSSLHNQKEGFPLINKCPVRSPEDDKQPTCVHMCIYLIANHSADRTTMEEANLLVLSQACTITKCGTFGCILRDRHLALHNFSLTGKRKRSCGSLPNTTNNTANNTANNTTNNTANNNDDDITAAQQLKRMCQSPTVPDIKAHPLQQVVIRVQPDGSVIMPGGTIPSLRIQRKWSSQETGGRAGWYKGTLTHISEDDTQVCVIYDDGDKHWEHIEEVQFL